MIVLALLCVVASGCGSSDSPPSANIDRCPQQAPKGVRGDSPRAANELFPTGASKALVCRYKEAGRPDGHWVSAPPSIERLEDQFDALKPVKSGGVACEAGFPIQYLLSVRYPEEEDVHLLVSFEGCGSVSNGVDDTIYYPVPKLRLLLDSLLTPDTQ